MANKPGEPRAPVRLLIADDQRLMRNGIASLLSLQSEVLVVGTAANGRETISQAEILQPDVILMDVRMPVMDGVKATGHIKRQFPKCKILMLTTFDDEEYVLEALLVGANGYLLKNMPEEDLVQAVIAVHKGIYQLDPAVAQKVVAVLSKNANANFNQIGIPAMAKPGQNSPSAQAMANSGLTEREFEILGLISQGLSNSEIAQRLLITEGTVKNHISSILATLKVRDRVQAAIYAREHGWA